MTEPMELDDYSGPFRPDLTFSDLSKTFLLRLMHHWQLAWLELDGAWFYAVRERLGFEAGIDCYMRAWPSRAKRLQPRYQEIANYRPETVREAMKGFHLGPGNVTGGLLRCEYDFKNDNHLIMTVVQCRTLLSHEVEEPEMIYPGCHILQKPVFESNLGNPRIRVAPLKLPPRNSPDEIACQWEFKLEE